MVKLQRCCQRLQVTTLSDMTTGDGRHLLPGLIAGVEPPVKLSPYNYPAQGQLPTATWRLWKTYLRKSFLRSQTNGQLEQPLGRWTAPVNLRNWKSWWDPAQQMVYLLTEDGWVGYPRQLGPQGNPAVRGKPPDTAIPAIAWMDGRHLKFTGSATGPPKDDTPQSLARELQKTPPAEQWITSFLRRDHDLGTLLQDIRAGTAIAVADGSFKNGLSTSGFTIRQALSERGITGANRVPGRAEVQCSYRSELAGILGIVTVLSFLHTAYDLTGGSMIIACDNLSAGQKSLEDTGPAALSQDHHDMLRLIRDKTAKLPLTIRYQHVEGHQLKKYPGRPLDRWARVNEEMDALAKAYWHHTALEPALPEQLTGQEWTVSSHAGKLCSRLSSLRAVITGRQLEQYWIKKGRFSRRQIDHMELRTIGKAMRRQPIHRKRFLAKFVTNQGPTGLNMERWKFWKKNNCPCCGRPKEDAQHVLECTAVAAIQAKETAFLAWEESMQQNWTSAPVLHGLRAIVNQVLFKRPVAEPSTFAPHVRQAMQAQLTIGWNQLLRGRIAKDWKIAQLHDWGTSKAARHANRWSIHLVEQCWQLTWSLWDNRNTILKSPEGQDRLHDMTQVNLAIREQWQIGTESVHPMDRRLWNAENVETILKRDSVHRRHWLAAARAARLNTLSDSSDDEN
jgi:hypothetical protein